MKEEALNGLTIEDMPNADMKLVAECCGIEIALKLLTSLPGISISVPKFGIRKIARDYIIKNYNGKNAKKLAFETGLTENYIYKILREERQPVSTDISIIQMEFFERRGSANDNSNGHV